MQALLLAAGFGTRLKPYSDIRPKPLFPVVNRPLLARILDSLQAAGCTRIVVNCHHLHGQITTAVQGYPGVSLQYEPEILGTGGAIAKAFEQLDRAPVLVVNGDIYHDIDLGRVYRQHLEHDRPVTMAMHDFPRFNGVGVTNGLVSDFNPQQGDILRAFTGIHVLDPETIELIPRDSFFHIIDLYAQLAKQRKIAMAEVDGCFWRDIGTPDDYLQLHGELLARAGRPGWVIDPSARIGKDVLLEDWGVIGPGCRVEEGARLCRAVVWEDARVERGRVCRDCILTGRDFGHGY